MEERGAAKMNHSPPATAFTIDIAARLERLLASQTKNQRYTLHLKLEATRL